MDTMIFTADANYFRIFSAYFFRTRVDFNP